MNFWGKGATWQGLVFMMGVCLFGLAVLSYVRLAIIGTPNLDGLPVNLPWEIIRRTTFFVLISAAGAAFLKLHAMEIDGTNLRGLLVGSLLLELIASLTLPSTSNDIFSNMAYGKMAQLGLNANLSGASALPADDIFRRMVSARWMHMPMVYGPVIGWINRLATRPESLWASMAIFKAVALMFSCAISTVVFLYCAKFLSGPARCRSFILFALNPAFLWEFSSQAHNDAVMVLSLACFVYFLAGNRHWESLGCAAFASVTKLAALPALGFYICHNFFISKKRFLSFCALLGLGGLISAGIFAGKLSTVLAIPSSGAIDPSRLTGTPLFLIYKFLAPFGAPAQSLGYRVAWVAGMLTMALLASRFALRMKAREQFLLYTLLFILLFNLIASPMYQPWYITWVFPFAMAIEDARLCRFVAIFSAISMSQYAITTSVIGAVINILILIFFWLYYWRSAGALGNASFAQPKAALTVL